GGNGGSDEPSGIAKEATADYGIAVYPNPVGSVLYVAGEKNLSKLEFIDLQTGAKVRSVALEGVSSAEVSVDGLPEGAYVVAIYVEGSSKPQVAKVIK
ncbi:MAG: T9SS type A sorting domain-containing protein, partial [Prevotellaceae bacterium]|nr:T9SS type A sorting domain-containing protein [Prevotellaceae bacterium]